MADNRMYLLHVTTRKAVFLGKNFVIGFEAAPFGPSYGGTTAITRYLDQTGVTVEADEIGAGGELRPVTVTLRRADDTEGQ